MRQSCFSIESNELLPKHPVKNITPGGEKPKIVISYLSPHPLPTAQVEIRADEDHGEQSKDPVHVSNRAQKSLEMIMQKIAKHEEEGYADYGREDVDRQKGPRLHLHHSGCEKSGNAKSGEEPSRENGSIPVRAKVFPYPDHAAGSKYTLEILMGDDAGTPSLPDGKDDEVTDQDTEKTDCEDGIMVQESVRSEITTPDQDGFLRYRKTETAHDQNEKYPYVSKIRGVTRRIHNDFFHTKPGDRLRNGGPISNRDKYRLNPVIVS